MMMLPLCMVIISSRWRTWFQKRDYGLREHEKINSFYKRSSISISAVTRISSIWYRENDLPEFDF